MGKKRPRSMVADEAGEVNNYWFWPANIELQLPEPKRCKYEESYPINFHEPPLTEGQHALVNKVVDMVRKERLIV